MNRRMAATQAMYEPAPTYEPAPAPAPAPAAPAPAPAAPEEPAYMAELQQLASLRDAGVLTDEEFEAKKHKILGI